MDEPAKKPRLVFSLRTLLEIVAVIAFVLSLIYSNVWLGADRYEMQIVEKNTPTVYLLDKRTGRVWVRQGTTSGSWFETGSLPNRP